MPGTWTPSGRSSTGRRATGDLPAARLRMRSAGFPDFLAGPLPGPFQAGQRVPGGRIRRWLDLDEILDLETAAAQQPDHVAVADVELHRVSAQPLEPVHAEVGPLQRLGGGQVVLLGKREDDLDRVDQEDELPA